MVGKPPYTLQDYFNSEVRGDPLEGTPVKKIKTDDYPTPPVHIQRNNMISQKPAGGNLPRDESVRKNIINLDADKRALKLASES